MPISCFKCGIRLNDDATVDNCLYDECDHLNSDALRDGFHELNFDDEHHHNRWLDYDDSLFIDEEYYDDADILDEEDLEYYYE